MMQMVGLTATILIVEQMPLKLVDRSIHDGIDNDADGWIDSDDPSCVIAQDNEDDGYALDENGILLAVMMASIMMVMATLMAKIGTVA